LTHQFAERLLVRDINEQSAARIRSAVFDVSLHPQGAVRELFGFHRHLSPLLGAILKRLESGTILDLHFAQQKAFGLEFRQHGSARSWRRTVCQSRERDLRFNRAVDALDPES